MLRPDRIPTTLTTYTQHHLASYNLNNESYSLEEILTDARKLWGVMILLPLPADTLTGHPASRLQLTRTPVDVLLNLAQTANIPIQHAVLTEGSGIEIEEMLNAADKANGWAIVESVHLASPEMVNKIIYQLQGIHQSREQSKEGSKFCIWLTTQTNGGLPFTLTENLLKISWNTVSLAANNKGSSSSTGTAEIQKTISKFNPLCPKTYLKTAIVSALQQVSESSLKLLQQASPLKKLLVFGVAILHGVLTARQLFGSVGLARLHPFYTTQINNAVDLITSDTLMSENQTEASLEDLSQAVSDVYCAMVSEEQDQLYIKTLCRDIFSSLHKNPQSKIQLGTAWIPVPPNSTDVTEMGDWFQQAVGDDVTLPALQLTTSTEKITNESSAAKFLSRLEILAETHNLDSGVGVPSNASSSIDVVKLRSALEICQEKLPLLLDLGEIPQMMKADYDFPYHSPSIISMSSAASSMMPESVSYVLLQECLWMNTVLCHIRQEIHDMDGNLLGGSGAIPRRLLPTVLSLQEEFVPVSWIHPNTQPCTHSLTSWLDDLTKRYQQLNRWVRRSMVPTFTNGQVTENYTVARGHLTTLWLGGLVNPQALLTAFRQEKAILSGASVDDVFFDCLVLNQVDHDDIDEGGLFVSDLYLENAVWDYQNNCLAESREASLVCLKCVYLKPTIRSSKASKPSDTVKSETLERSRVCQLPVFINKSRQIQICSLPVNCSSNSDENWILRRTAFLLDPGLLEGGSKKSRAFLMLNRFPPMMRTEQEESTEEENGEAEDQAGDPQEYELEDSEESARSQLSYKPMSPNAPPLPDSLALKREPPIFKDDFDIKVEDGRGSGGKSQKSPVNKEQPDEDGRGQLNENAGSSSDLKESKQTTDEKVSNYPRRYSRTSPQQPKAEDNANVFDESDGKIKDNIETKKQPSAKSEILDGKGEDAKVDVENDDEEDDAEEEDEEDVEDDEGEDDEDLEEEDDTEDEENADDQILNQKGDK
ncbi:hypothetical protein Btru_021541 [Bulinus truncatus]|nr:hypothetical protein Btru_021541 [Bulinus truncatus]